MELHRGTDFRAAPGTPVLAMIDGVIGGLFEDAEGGICLRLCGPSPDGRYPDPATYFWSMQAAAEGSIGHNDSGWRITYCHLQEYMPTTRLGAVVKRGDVIALSGATGRNADGTPVAPHLHVSCEWLEDGLWDSRTFIDPALLLGQVITQRAPVAQLPPGQFIARDAAVIVPANQPGNVAKRGSVVINVSENGTASVNMGNGASLAGNVNVALPGGRAGTGQ